MTQILFCLGEKSFGNVLLFEKPLLELYLWLVFDYYVCVGNCCTDTFVCMSKATSKKRHLTWYRLTIFKVFIQSFEFWWVFVSILFVCLFVFYLPCVKLLVKSDINQGKREKEEQTWKKISLLSFWFITITTQLRNWTVSYTTSYTGEAFICWSVCFIH